MSRIIGIVRRSRAWPDIEWIDGQLSIIWVLTDRIEIWLTIVVIPYRMFYRNRELSTGIAAEIQYRHHDEKDREQDYWDSIYCALTLLVIHFQAEIAWEVGKKRD